MKSGYESQITNHKSLDHIALLLALYCLSASSGFLSGRLITNYESRITLSQDQRPPVPTINIEGIRNGLLHGSIKGSARISIGSQILTESGVFALDASRILRNEITIIVPDGMHFVASTRGKKYYSVHSSAGEKLSPKNRIYFQTSAQAELAGYSTND